MATALQVCQSLSKALHPLWNTLIFHAGKPAETVRENELSSMYHLMMGLKLNYNSWTPN